MSVAGALSSVNNIMNVMTGTQRRKSQETAPLLQQEPHSPTTQVRQVRVLFTLSSSSSSSSSLLHSCLVISLTNGEFLFTLSSSSSLLHSHLAISMTNGENPLYFPLLLFLVLAAFLPSDILDKWRIPLYLILIFILAAFSPSNIHDKW